MTEDSSFIYLIGRVDHGIRTELGRRLRPLELSVAQFTTLSVLDRQPGLSNAQLARRALVTPQAMNEVLATLERRGLVSRHGPPARGRIRHASLTPAGHTRLSAAISAATALQDQLLNPIPASERGAALTALRSIMQSLSARAATGD